MMDDPVTAFVARRVADLVLEVDTGLARLDGATDREALHDLRVALRRLRSCLALHREHAPVARALRRRLRRLARATTGLRDLEAVHERLVSWARRAELREQRAIRFHQRIWQPPEAAYIGLATDTARAWGELRRQLLRAVRELEAQRDAQSYRSVLPMLASQQARCIVEAAAAARGTQDLHQVRIGLKRLRYLLEPVADVHPSVVDALTLLRSQQESFGELNDCVVVLARISDGLAEAARVEVAAAVRDDTPAPGARTLRRHGLVLAGLVGRRQAALTRTCRRACRLVLPRLPGMLDGLAQLRAGEVG